MINNNKFLTTLFSAVVAFSLFTGFTHTALAATITVVDDRDRKVEINVPVKRVVVFNKYNTEFFRSVAGQDVIVGMAQDVNKLEGYWPGLGKESVAGQNQREPHYEKIVSLKPDVVVFPKNGAWKDASAKLAEFGIPVVVITGWDVNKYASNLTMIGQLTGNEDRAAKLIATHTKYTNLLKDRLKGVPKVSMYLETKGGVHKSVVPGSGWHDMLEQAGGSNIFGDINWKSDKGRGSKHSYDIDPEAVLARNPGVILKQIGTGHIPPSQEVMASWIKDFKSRPGYANIEAVKNDRIFVMTYFVAGGLSKLLGKLYIAKQLHPDLFKDVDVDKLANEYYATYQVALPGPHTLIAKVVEKTPEATTTKPWYQFYK